MLITVQLPPYRVLHNYSKAGISVSFPALSLAFFFCWYSDVEDENNKNVTYLYLTVFTVSVETLLAMHFAALSKPCHTVENPVETTSLFEFIPLKICN